jgi:1-acyl-sn-glycerol-3-phosphate acyltransferase
MLFLRSLAFNLFFWLWGAVCLLVCLPALLMHYSNVFVVGRIWVVGSFAALRVLCGLGYEIRGHDNLPAAPFIYASKHQSAWDTLILALLLDQPTVVLKRELLRIPIFGWYLTKGRMVAIDRGGRAQTLRTMVEQGKARAAEGRSIVIFPEGTRVAPGKHRAYHPGVFALYKALDLPVVPVALNSGVFWGRKAFIKRPGKIILEILPPIAPGLDRKPFLGQLKQSIDAASDRLSAEATGGEPARQGKQPSHAENIS